MKKRLINILLCSFLILAMLVGCGTDAAVTAVQDQISALGEITLESEAAVESANAAYNALTDEQKAQVENADILIAAVAKVEQLIKEEEARIASEKAIADVENQISKLGEITLDSRDTVDKVLDAYNHLTEEEKTKVSNADILLSAKEEVDRLVAEDERKYGYLREHDITISPVGEYSFMTEATERYRDNYVKDIMVSCYIEISENTDGCEEGYKNVVAKVSYDFSKGKEYDISYEDRIFDRYTGVVFSQETPQNVKVYRNGVHKEGMDDLMVIDDGDENYSIQLQHDIENNWPKCTDTYTVTCPESYNGTVFRIGYSDCDYEERYAGIDFSEKQYTIDEVDEICQRNREDHEIYYCTYTDD